MQTPRIFGHISDVAEGTTFASRAELRTAGVHKQIQAGISGGSAEGADSIVVSGGYEDDEDYGDVIIYTGHGGNNPSSGRQIAGQELARGNLALAKSCIEGLPVRVIRGAGGNPAYSPPAGYRYDGLYYVDEYWTKKGRSGYAVWRYRLVRSPHESQALTGALAPSSGQPQHALVTVQRVVRSGEIARWVKQIHEHRCQVCGERIETPAGPYAEGVRIRPLGAPHHGPDEIGNMLCLCPNDHVRLDYGAIVIADDLMVIDTRTSAPLGRLRTNDAHPIDRAALAYHRGLFGGR